jgi:hypothetical protein
MRRLPVKYDLTAMSQSAEETNDLGPGARPTDALGSPAWYYL